MSDTDVPIKRKLIEVALPLEAINRESAREKSIRHGHPSTLHLWWARRPLAACRAVLFAQLVDDPSSHPEKFPTEELQAKERRRLFDLIERLVVWENTNDERLLREAHEEIAACFDGKPPAILDPFAGGGSIPLEAQRLGLEAHASDLNPVAVLINKALIELPPKFAGQPPVFPGAAESRMGDWPRATGLAEDVRRYGQWMGDEAEKRIGHLYPKATLPDGGKANVIAWICARTVTCPNPACGAEIPLVSSWWLAKKKSRPTWILPVVSGKSITFEIMVDKAGPPPPPKVGRGAKFSCLVCGDITTDAYVKSEANSGRMSARLLAIVAEGNRRRVYLPSDRVHSVAVHIPRPENFPDAPIPTNPRWFSPPGFGLENFADLFTGRQLTALTEFGHLVSEVRERVVQDAAAIGLSPLVAGSYADAVATYLAFAVSRASSTNATTCRWRPDAAKESINDTFARQAIPMVWDYAEGNPFVGGPCSPVTGSAWIARVLDHLPSAGPAGMSAQSKAQTLRMDRNEVVATDPPYYDNIGYADLSDFFYVWLRHILVDIYPTLMSTMLAPKADELIATPYRFEGSKKNADLHFESGFVETFAGVRSGQSGTVPLTVFYAFKQAESDDSGTVSTGWEKMLNGLIEAGLSVTATWPMRTELSNRMISSGTNALASSIVLACRPRPEGSGNVSRRSFIAELKSDLPRALRELQQGSVAPVDLAQAAIGPGMAIFSRYSGVLEPDGTRMTVRTALSLINQVLDEVLSEQEGDFDADTRFCVKWFTQFGWDEQEYGRADELSRSTNTSVDGLVRGDIFWARTGRARLLEPVEYSDEWHVEADERISIWEVVLRMAKALNEQGGPEAARIMAQSEKRVDLDAAKELAYLLFSICERRGWTQTALLFNGLGTSWSDLAAAARAGGALTPPPAQGELDFGMDGE